MKRSRRVEPGSTFYFRNSSTLVSRVLLVEKSKRAVLGESDEVQTASTSGGRERGQEERTDERTWNEDTRSVVAAVVSERDDRGAPGRFWFVLAY